MGCILWFCSYDAEAHGVTRMKADDGCHSLSELPHFGQSYNLVENLANSVVGEVVVVPQSGLVFCLLVFESRLKKRTTLRFVLQ